jgi:hypothetical protein
MHGKEFMVLVDAINLAGLLTAYRCAPTVVVDDWSVLRLWWTTGAFWGYGFGTTLDEASADLVSELQVLIGQLVGQLGLTPADIEELPPDQAPHPGFDYWSGSRT